MSRERITSTPPPISCFSHSPATLKKSSKRRSTRLSLNLATCRPSLVTAFMALRHPPKEIIPPAERKKPRGPRVVRFEEPPEGFWRRWRRRLIRPATVIPTAVLAVITVGVLGYYYPRSEEHTSELQSLAYLVSRL